MAEVAITIINQDEMDAALADSHFISSAWTFDVDSSIAAAGFPIFLGDAITEIEAGGFDECSPGGDFLAGGNYIY